MNKVGSDFEVFILTGHFIISRIKKYSTGIIEFSSDKSKEARLSSFASSMKYASYFPTQDKYHTIYMPIPKKEIRLNYIEANS